MHLQPDPSAAQKINTVRYRNANSKHGMGPPLFVFLRKKEVINKIITEMQPPVANRRTLRLLSYSIVTGNA